MRFPPGLAESARRGVGKDVLGISEAASRPPPQAPKLRQGIDPVRTGNSQVGFAPATF
jgi:hypothetical protein